MKLIIYPLSVIVFVLSSQISLCQTIVKGKVTSVDGREIPKTVISINPQDPGDIFSGYDDIFPGEDGSYQLTLAEPGIYNITFRGIYHKTIRLPVLIIDQPVVELDLLLLPVVLNDGRYLGNEAYLEWIRVVGNFNDYEFTTGKRFYLNDDGSISAFIPINSDTIRYQVRGLNYRRGGPTPLPPADEYNIREDRSFESVLYTDLPKDSLEIRYTPGQPMPFQRYIQDNEEFSFYNVNGFISFPNSADRYWVEPLIRIREFWSVSIPIVEHHNPFALSEEEQADYQQKFLNSNDAEFIQELKNSVLESLNEPDLHQQQIAILSMAYASIMSRIESRGRHINEFHRIEGLDELEIDLDIIKKIPEWVSPVHPAWNFAQLLPDFLLAVSGDQMFIDYYENIVQYHPDERVVRMITLALIRNTAELYDAIEKMNIYQLIIERYGERMLARDAHMVFNRIKSETTD